MKIYLCVAPDGSLELWHTSPRYWNRWKREADGDSVMHSSGFTRSYETNVDHEWASDIPEFWGREIIDEWIQ